MNKYKLITNISYADYEGVRIWCHGFLIQMTARDAFREHPIRQMHAQGYGGLNVCTFWIDPKSEIKLEDAEGNTVLLSHDGNAYNLGGLIVRATERGGKPLVIALGIDDFRGKIVIEDLEQESCPFGDEFDERVLPHAGGQAYPRVEWTMIPERFKKKPVSGRKV